MHATNISPSWPSFSEAPFSSKSMFSHLITAARGLFVRQDPERALDNANTPEIETATRQGAIDSKQAANGSDQIVVTTKGKRRARPASAGKTDDQQAKRRKQSSLETPNANVGDTPNEETWQMNGIEEDKETATSAKSNHLRFGSEEPTLPEEALPDEISAAPNHEEDRDNSDGDTPEAIDNSAQRLKIKEQAKQQEKAKRVQKQLKKEKRRKLDKRRKLQAKSAAKSKDTSRTLDDSVSKSTTTLQGSNPQDAQRRALPALLPDEILNAEADARPPTPPVEDGVAGPKKSKKLKFLDKTDKPPKDVKVGDVAIRVLESKKKKSQSTLPAKASKAEQNVKDNLLKRNRSMAQSNGLRWTAGGPSSFVRR